MNSTDILLTDQQTNVPDLEKIGWGIRPCYCLILFMWQKPNVQNEFVEVVNEINQYILGKSCIVYWTDIKLYYYHTTGTEPDKFRISNESLLLLPGLLYMSNIECQIQFVELANKTNQIWAYYAR